MMGKFALVGAVIGAVLGIVVVFAMSDGRATAGVFFGIALIFSVIAAFIAMAVFGAVGTKYEEKHQREAAVQRDNADVLRQQREARLVVATACLGYDPKTAKSEALVSVGLRGEPWHSGFVSPVGGYAVVTRPLTPSECDQLIAAVVAVGGKAETPPQLAIADDSRRGWDDAIGGEYVALSDVQNAIKMYDEAKTMIGLLA